MREKNTRGLFQLVDVDRRIEIEEEIQMLFEELYGAIDSVRSETQFLARGLREIFFGTNDPDKKDDWQSRIMP